MSAAMAVEPMATVSRAVRTKPRMRDTRVPAAMMALDFAVLSASEEAAAEAVTEAEAEPGSDAETGAGSGAGTGAGGRTVLPVRRWGTVPGRRGPGESPRSGVSGVVVGVFFTARSPTDPGTCPHARGVRPARGPRSGVRSGRTAWR
ncbi:hypothetical protein ACFFX0_17050 [Citricoccus parietis]|uniref:Uncharacterized protein n=1 Tax=Citricoccus parietis TaxID=592307 RepID=A0ABV5G2C6_9MICC